MYPRAKQSTTEPTPTALLKSQMYWLVLQGVFFGYYVRNFERCGLLSPLELNESAIEV